MKPSEPPRGIQTIIHSLEEGGGKIWLRRLLGLILLVLSASLYQINEARNFRSPEAMDAAQLGRGIAAGRGYTTGVIRPLSLHLLQERAAQKGEDPRQVIARAHPDLENPPVYPILLSVVFRVMPASWWTRLPADEFRRRPVEEVAISGLNLALFGVVIFLAGWLGARLFDATAGWVAAALIFGTEPFWNFANSGLPTMLLMASTVALVHLLLSYEQESVSEAPRGRRMAALAAAAGGLVGLMFLTRYAFGWLIVPVGVYLIWRGGAWRFRLGLLALAATLVLGSPWVARNWRLSGTPLGTASYTLLSGTESFPYDRLERSQHPKFERGQAVEVFRKLVTNTRDLVRDDVLLIGGNWITAFFFVGLLVPFGSPSLNRLRYFLLGALVVLALTQAVTRTWITTVVGSISGENLIVVLAPVLFVFATGFLLTLLDHVEWPAPAVRTLVIGAVVGVFSLPFVLTLLPPREFTLQDPPYRPRLIREFADYTPQGTLFMSDIPWAMAWYGPRECVWATLRVQDTPADNVANRREDYFTFVEARRPVEAVYISPHWADQPFQSRFMADPDFAWGRFVLDVRLRGNLPAGFPLKNVLGGGYMQAGHFLLGAKDWWSNRPGH